jgi:hypothetical protein
MAERRKREGDANYTLGPRGLPIPVDWSVGGLSGRWGGGGGDSGKGDGFGGGRGVGSGRGGGAEVKRKGGKKTAVSRVPAANHKKLEHDRMVLAYESAKADALAGLLLTNGSLMVSPEATAAAEAEAWARGELAVSAMSQSTRGDEREEEVTREAETRIETSVGIGVHDDDHRHQQKSDEDVEVQKDEEEADDDDDYGDDFEKTTTEGSANAQKEGFNQTDDVDGKDDEDDAAANGNDPRGAREPPLPSSYVGRRVVKLFEIDGEMEPYPGKVVACNDEGGSGVATTFMIEYDDGDEEELDLEELEEILVDVVETVDENKKDEDARNHDNGNNGDKNSENLAAATAAAADDFASGSGDSASDETPAPSEEEEGAENESGASASDALLSPLPRSQLATSQKMSAFTPAPKPIAELSIEEMMVTNLQRQISGAIEAGDLNKASELNAKLAVLEESLLK